MKLCPRCATPLEETRVGAVLVDGCNGCGGVWFDYQEMNAIALSSQLAYLEARFQPASTPKNVQHNPMCPVCKTDLVAFTFQHSPDIILDSCTQCRGIWADEGETQAIFRRILEMQGMTAMEFRKTESVRQKARQAMRFLAQIACPQCGKANPRVSLQCSACASSLDGNDKALCPLCDQPLHQISMGESPLEACPECCGIWISQKHLSEVARHSPTEIARMEEALGKPQVIYSPEVVQDIHPVCPRCNQALEERAYAYHSSVKIEVCVTCDSVWLERGELVRAAEYLQRTLT